MLTENVRETYVRKTVGEDLRAGIQRSYGLSQTNDNRAEELSAFIAEVYGLSDEKV